MYVYLDVDETLTNSIKAVLTVLNKRYNTNYKAYQVTTWNFTNLFPDMTNEEIEEIFNSDDFFENLKFKPYAKKWLKQQHELNNVTLVTHGSQINLQKKKKWFEQQGFKNINFIGLPHEINKGNIDMSDALFIDDCKSNLECSNAKYKVLYKNIPDGEWLKDWNGMYIKSFRGFM